MDVDDDDQIALQWKWSVREGEEDERMEKGAMLSLSPVLGLFIE